MDKVKRTVGFIYHHPLGRRHLVRCLTRFALWQIQSGFLPSKLIKKRFIGTLYFKARRGLTGITGNIYTGLHEFNDMCFLLHFLDKSDAFFDIGANVGSYTLLAAGICGSKTVAMEPVRSTFQLLEQNVVLNKLSGNVELINAGAGSEAGVIFFSSDEDTTNHAISNEEVPVHAEPVSIIKIDSLLSRYIPSIVKIDVEGYETKVLEGMPELLREPRLKSIIIELNGSGKRYGFDEGAIHNKLLDSGFMPFDYDPFNRLLVPVSTFVNKNTIYCRDHMKVQEKLKCAQRIMMMGEYI
jgi:FkbM family methyltransferase